MKKEITYNDLGFWGSLIIASIWLAAGSWSGFFWLAYAFYILLRKD